MASHANGTVYGKYLKIKNGSQGVKNCSRYINDPDKTMAPIGDGEREIFHMENALRYIQNDPKTRNPLTSKPLVSGHNCSPDTAVQEFALIERLYQVASATAGPRYINPPLFFKKSSSFCIYDVLLSYHTQTISQLQ